MIIKDFIDGINKNIANIDVSYVYWNGNYKFTIKNPSRYDNDVINIEDVFFYYIIMINNKNVITVDKHLIFKTEDEKLMKQLSNSLREIVDEKTNKEFLRTYNKIIT